MVKVNLRLRLPHYHERNRVYYSVFGSIATIVAMIVAVTSGRISDVIGRKGAMWALSVFCLAGWLAIYFAQGVVSLDIGRLSTCCTSYGMGLISYVKKKASDYARERVIHILEDVSDEVNKYWEYDTDGKIISITDFFRSLCTGGFDGLNKDFLGIVSMIRSVMRRSNVNENDIPLELRSFMSLLSAYTQDIDVEILKQHPVLLNLEQHRTFILKANEHLKVDKLGYRKWEQFLAARQVSPALSNWKRIAKTEPCLEKLIHEGYTEQPGSLVNFVCDCYAHINQGQEVISYSETKLERRLKIVWTGDIGAVVSSLGEEPDQLCLGGLLSVLSHSLGFVFPLEHKLFNCNFVLRVKCCNLNECKCNSGCIKYN